MIRVFGVVTLTTLVVGLSALAVAFLVVDDAVIDDLQRHGYDITDDAAFARAGTMHNFSYLGGFLGLITGGIAIVQHRRRQDGLQRSEPTDLPVDPLTRRHSDSSGRTGAGW